MPEVTLSVGAQDLFERLKEKPMVFTYEVFNRRGGELDNLTEFLNTPSELVDRPPEINLLLRQYCARVKGFIYFVVALKDLTESEVVAAIESFRSHEIEEAEEDHEV